MPGLRPAGGGGILAPGLAILLPLLAAPAGEARALDAPLPDAGAPLVSCILEIQGYDAGGAPVLRAPAYRLREPGVLVAPLHVLERTGARWQRLRAVPDPGGRGALAAGGGAFDVLEALEIRADLDLAILRAPGLEGCGGDSGPAIRPGPEGGGATAPLLSAGTRLFGVRDRDGYRPRLFRAVIDRPLKVPGGPSMALVKVADGGGVDSGFLFDAHERLVGAILPSPPGSDPGLAGAAEIEPVVLEASPARLGRPLRADLSTTGPAFSTTAAGLLMQALLLTRDDQIDRALQILDGAAASGAAFAELFLTRGTLEFRSGKPGPAIHDFTLAIQADPRLHLAYYNLGIALGAEGRFLDASRALEQALAIDPRHARTRYQLALALKAARVDDRARAQYEALARIDPPLALDLGQLLGF